MSHAEALSRNGTSFNILKQPTYARPPIYTFFVSALLLASVIILCHFYLITQRTSHLRLSNQLKIHLITLLVCMGCAFVSFANFALNVIAPSKFKVVVWNQKVYGF
jgi:hypothetical protein